MAPAANAEQHVSGVDILVAGANMDPKWRNSMIEMKVVDSSLRIRSTRTAHAYVGRNAAALTDNDGFVDSGDIVELRGDRYYFVICIIAFCGNRRP